MSHSIRYEAPSAEDFTKHPDYHLQQAVNVSQERVLIGSGYGSAVTELILAIRNETNALFALRGAASRFYNSMPSDHGGSSFHDIIETENKFRHITRGLINADITLSDVMTPEQARLFSERIGSPQTLMGSFAFSAEHLNNALDPQKVKDWAAQAVTNAAKTIRDVHLMDQRTQSTSAKRRQLRQPQLTSAWSLVFASKQHGQALENGIRIGVEDHIETYGADIATGDIDAVAQGITDAPYVRSVLEDTLSDVNASSHLG